MVLAPGGPGSLRDLFFGVDEVQPMVVGYVLRYDVSVVYAAWS